jgi:predicted ATPase/signal transduction histidine kinase
VTAAVSGYELGGKLYESSRSVVFRAVRLSDAAPVIIKTLASEYPTAAEIARMTREHDMLASLDLPGVVRAHEVTRHNQRPALVVEDFGARSLGDLSRERPFSTEEVLAIGAQIAETLGQLHRRGVVHKDVNPQNVLQNPQTGVLKIIDFDLASPLAAESGKIRAQAQLEGTLRYIAPEQTGRMNRAVDSRADLYSLGATLHELLTGSPPFASNDPMELVHAHIARRPPAPHELRPDVPPAVSAVVQKLLAKAPEDRYQSAFGLKADLERCLAELRRTGAVADFPLGERDVPDTLQIPHALYGREAEVERLREAFHRAAAGGVSLLLLSGQPGVGKSALVNELRGPVAVAKGRFCAGKFDQLQRDVPYSAFTAAFSDLVRQALAESEEELGAVRASIVEAAGASAGVLAALIPEAALLLGDTPAPPALGPADAIVRFNFVLRSFVAAFATRGRPLVVFLDDLQWADAPSLKLLQSLLTDASAGHTLFVCAYREGEVPAGHPLPQAVASLREAGALVETLSLGPLDASTVRRFVDETVRCGPSRAEELGALVFERTQGNPFFVGQLLKSMRDDELLRFDTASGSWQWDIADIRRRGLTGDVVELMVTRIRRLSPRAQELLTLAACTGNPVDTELLCIASERSAAEVEGALAEAAQHDLLLARERAEGSRAKDAPAGARYEFVHDRVQQAAYSLLPEAQRAVTHLKIGRRLLAGTPDPAASERLFDIVHHLGLGLDLVTSREEQARAVELHLAAVVRAIASAAYESAHRYATAALRLVSEEDWERARETTFSLHVEAMSAAYLANQLAHADELADTALRHASSKIERVRVLETRMRVCVARTDMETAYRLGAEALSLLGLDLPPASQADEMTVMQAIMKARAVLGERNPADLAALPEMTSPEDLAVVRLLDQILVPAWVLNPRVLAVAGCEAVAFCAQRGNTGLASSAYANYAMLQAAFGEFDGAAAFIRLATDIVERYGTPVQRAFVILGEQNCYGQWTNHVRESVPPMRTAIQLAIDGGNLQVAGFLCAMIVGAQMYVGIPMDRLFEEIAAGCGLAARIGQEMSRRYMLCNLLVCERLSNAVDRAKIAGRSYTPQELVASLGEAKDGAGVFTFHTASLMAAYLLGDMDAATAAATSAEPLQDTSRNSHAGFVTYKFYHALWLCARCRSLPEAERAPLLRQIGWDLGELRTWAARGPDNVLHKARLVEAEEAALRGDLPRAMAAYDEAVATAVRSGYVHEEALALERAADFYASLGRERIAATYMAEARQAYLQWGATVKVAQLEERYPALRVQRAPGASMRSESSISTSSEAGQSAVLDLTTVMKAARAVSSEIVLEKLLAKLLQMLVENAGAERATLLLFHDGRLRVEARLDAGGEVAHGGGPPDAATLPLSILSYVARTRESVVLGDAVAEGLFSRDPYILSARPRSVLCAPLLNQGKPTAVVYLENNLTAGAFTADRVEMLRLLSAQAALSIHNAGLYSELQEYSRTLEQKVDERTRELRDKNDALASALDSLRAAQSQLVTQEKLASLGALTAGIAHELRNPLNFVNNFAQLATSVSRDLGELLAPIRKDLPPASREDLDYQLEALGDSVTKIESHGRRATQIIDSMLLHARDSSMERQPTDLNALIADAVRLGHQGTRKDASPPLPVKIDLDLSPDAGMVEVAPAEMGRVFLNVVQNAVYAMAQKRRAAGDAYAPQLTVRSRAVGDRVEVRVRDNGTGMTPEVAARIFEPFFTTKPPGEGSGLGLSLSHDIVVQAHGGEMGVTTEKDQYTEILVRFPRSPQPAKDGRAPRSEVSPKGGRAGS